jgi:hypothetical protein
VSPRLRKLTLTAHIVSSVGWLGAVVAYLALAVGALNGVDPLRAQAAYLTLETLGWTVILPFALAALATGLVQSLATPWGVFRHWWITLKLTLTVGGTTVLLLHLPTVTRMAQLALSTALATGDHRQVRTQLVVHAAGGLVVLLTATTLSVFKPWGLTPYGKRQQLEPRAEPSAATPWSVYALAALGALILLFLALHLIAGGPRAH